MDRKLPHIILPVGPNPYLFWTTGLYYLWELSKTHSVSLIVNEDYKIDPLFHDIISLCAVEEVIYLPNRSSIIARHRFYSRVLKDLVLKNPDSMILQHNDVYPDDLYLMYFAKRNKNNNKIVIYQVARSAINYAADYGARIDFAVNGLRNKWKIPFQAAKFLYYIRGESKQLLEFYLLPFIMIGNFLTPKLKLHSGRLIQKNIWKDIDFKLYYKSIEMHADMEIEGDTNNQGKRELIRHPLETVGLECNARLYQCKAENLISILPTWGLADNLMSEMGYDRATVVKWIVEKWSETIELLTENLSEWKIAWKLHPSAAANPILQSVTSALRRSFPRMTILQASEKSTQLILRSKIILSDVSSVLWWASFLEGKISISMDVFDYPGGDDMKGYDGILYFRTMAELSTFIKQFSTGSFRKEKVISTRKLPLLTEFIHSIEEKPIH